MLSSAQLWSEPPYHALGAHADPQDGRPSARAMGIEAVNAIGDLGHRRALRLTGPDEVVVLTGRERHPRRDGVPGRPPRTEHVRTHHVSINQPRL